jgi:hypothetical protein
MRQTAVLAPTDPLDKFTDRQTAHEPEDRCLAQVRTLDKVVEPEHLTLTAETLQERAGADNSLNLRIR